ncbi:MAG: AraC family transcriptional regulator [Bacteroidota bacterium]
MKPEYEKIARAIDRSFSIKTVDRPKRPTLKEAWHYHPEIEICLTTKSEGRRFVGNVISEYQAGDLAMFGKNLPHGYLTEMHCYQIVLQFTPAFLGTDFQKKPEFLPLQNLFNNARRGLVFSGKTQKKASRKLGKLLTTEGLGQVIQLLDLLHLLATTEEYEAICNNAFLEDPKEEHLDRVKKVYDHIFQHYHRNIGIREIADLLCLTETSFCKFIKRHTKKTFSQILNETRIGFACKLLINTDKTIAAISDECGFNSTSYFNRTFKKIMNVTPQRYRASYNV